MTSLRLLLVLMFHAISSVQSDALHSVIFYKHPHKQTELDFPNKSSLKLPDAFIFFFLH